MTTVSRTDPTGNQLSTYRDRLSSLPPLTPGVDAEHAVRTDWIAGVYIGGRRDPNATVELCRWADPGSEHGGPDVEYEIRLTNDELPISLTIEAAQLLGACLLQAAATATWDVADNVEYLTAVPEDGR